MSEGLFFQDDLSKEQVQQALQDLSVLSDENQVPDMPFQRVNIAARVLCRFLSFDTEGYSHYEPALGEQIVSNCLAPESNIHSLLYSWAKDYELERDQTVTIPNIRAQGRFNFIASSAFGQALEAMGVSNFSYRRMDMSGMIFAIKNVEHVVDTMDQAYEAAKVQTLALGEMLVEFGGDIAYEPPQEAIDEEVVPPAEEEPKESLKESEPISEEPSKELEIVPIEPTQVEFVDHGYIEWHEVLKTLKNSWDAKDDNPIEKSKDKPLSPKAEEKTEDEPETTRVRVRRGRRWAWKEVAVSKNEDDEESKDALEEKKGELPKEFHNKSGEPYDDEHSNRIYRKVKELAAEITDREIPAEEAPKPQ